ncbi:MAG: class I SAM-dependent methyltransferase, partial [Thermoplasmatales archaeon]|nr:class I SAM-dependent methyltransferase [Thermoplasmatales archaeon]
KEGFEVVTTDIHQGYDFLKFQPEDFDIIVTNPPYSLKDKFLRRAYELGKPFAFLLPLTTLEGRARQAMFASHGISLLIPDRRTNFITPDGKGCGSWFLTAWFTWQLLEKDLVFQSCIQQMHEVIVGG